MSRKSFLRLAALLAILVWVTWAWADSKGEEGATKPAVQWLAYGEALQKAEKENKHVIVDFYTNWCGWCKVMDRKTYTDAAVVDLLERHFVVAKVNAESSRKFSVGEEEISGRELAKQFGVTQFPMTWFLKPDGSRLANLPGYIPPERFTKVLEYVHERRYAKAPPQEESPQKP
jgi:thioredoxin-related protein